MSGLLALLDDVAGIAKVAAASVDDIASQAAQAGAKAAGALIDDAAVTPKYVHGFAASRELPIIWKIARGSFKNKLLYLLPVAMLLSTFAPWAISPLLMIGGAYLCFEGAEKIWHALVPHDMHEVFPEDKPGDPAHLEEQKAAGAIKTDFILSAEIMTIALAAIPSSTLWMEAATLAVVGIGITVAVYGSVALIVKMDDIGLFLARRGRLALTRRLGCGIVRAMPVLMRILSTVGTAAMIWVGGSILVHGVAELGWPLPYDTIHHWAETVAHAAGIAEGFVQWAVTAFCDGVIGLALGLLLIPVATKVLVPLWGLFAGRKTPAH